METFITKHKKYFVPSVILFLFMLRLINGLCSTFWLEDEIQVYAIGLKFFSTHHFPYFGPDIVYTNSQVPGSLQGLMVGLPFFITPIPEAPYILLNILSMSALIFFALYLQRKFPGVPIWFTWIWIFICPWAINYSTHIINISYLLFGSILFFVGFFESIPKLSIGFLKLRTAFFLMGFSFFWIFQFHMSWVLLLPFIGASLWFSFRKNKSSLLFLLLGSLITASFVIPTYLHYGLHAGSGGSASNVVFNASNLLEIGNIIMRLVSYATYELWHFIDFGDDTQWHFFTRYYWAMPFLFFVIAIGVLQWAYLVISFFRKNNSTDFKWIKTILLITIIITYCSFLFSVKAPSSHTFYLLFPLMIIYSFYCWQTLFVRKWFRILMVLLLCSGIITQVVLIDNNARKVSLYKNRDLPLKAIQQSDYTILTNRRSFDRNQ